MPAAVADPVVRAADRRVRVPRAVGVPVPRVAAIVARVPKGRTGPRPERPPREAPAPKPKPKRLSPARTHRDALLDGLSEAERRIAEQLMTGGINAVRQALDAQSARRSRRG